VYLFFSGAGEMKSIKNLFGCLILFFVITLNAYAQSFDFEGTYYAKHNPRSKITITKIKGNQYSIKSEEWENVSTLVENKQALKGTFTYIAGDFKGKSGDHYMEYIGNGVIKVTVSWIYSNEVGEWYMIKETEGNPKDKSL
jgi:hypothetical protein